MRFINFHNLPPLSFSEGVDLEVDEGAKTHVDGPREGEGSAEERDGRGFTSRLGTRTLSKEVGVSGVGVVGSGDEGVFPSASLRSTEMRIV
jgi:hypothetical protein